MRVTVGVEDCDELRDDESLVVALTPRVTDVVSDVDAVTDAVTA